MMRRRITIGLIVFFAIVFSAYTGGWFWLGGRGRASEPNAASQRRRPTASRCPWNRRRLPATRLGSMSTPATSTFTGIDGSSLRGQSVRAGVDVTALRTATWSIGGPIAAQVPVSPRTAPGRRHGRPRGRPSHGRVGRGIGCSRHPCRRHCRRQHAGGRDHCRARGCRLAAVDRRERRRLPRFQRRHRQYRALAGACRIRDRDLLGPDRSGADRYATAADCGPVSWPVGATATERTVHRPRLSGMGTGADSVGRPSGTGRQSPASRAI